MTKEDALEILKIDTYKCATYCEYVVADYNVKGLIDEIYDELEKRVCENCEHYHAPDCLVINDWDCYNDEPAQWTPPSDFGCNKYSG